MSLQYNALVPGDPIIKPQIIFEDTHVAVIDKPAGLLSQGEHTGDANLVDWLRQYFGRNYVGLVHRLDRNTSGILVVGKRSKSAQRLTDALQDGRLERSYLGWIEGTLNAPVRWEHWLLKNEARNIVKAVAQGTRGAKAAVLYAKPIQSGSLAGKPITLAEFTLETGRSHQIRAQAACEGHALVGDAKYGSRLSFPRPALHSHRISFPHPMSGEVMSFEAKLPADMAALG